MATRFVVRADLVDILPNNRVRVQGLQGSPLSAFEFDKKHVQQIKNCGTKLHIDIKTTSAVARTLQAMLIENRVINDNDIRG